MTKNVSFDEQKHRILINSNVREDGTLIHDKNKVDFTISSNQISDNNINNVGTSKSFLRTDSTYRPRSYDKSNKVISLSQSQPYQHKEIIRNKTSQTSVCNKCKRSSETHRRLQQHQQSCKENQVTHSNLTILSSKSNFLTAYTWDNIWNENATLIKSKIDPCLQSNCILEKSAFLITKWSSRKEIH